MSQARRFCLWALSLLLCQAIFAPASARPRQGAAHTADEAAIQSLVDEFFAAYAKKDLTRLLHLWDEKSPDLPAWKAATVKTFSGGGEAGPKILTVSRISFEGQKARARVEVEFGAVGATAGKIPSSAGRMNRALLFVKERDGWKVWRDVQVEEEIAAALLSQKSEPERKALLDAERGLDVVALRRALLRTGNGERLRDNYAAALNVFNVMLKAAEHIGDETGVSIVLSNIGLVYSSQGDPDRALEIFERSLAIDERLGNKREAALTLNRIGVAYRQQGNYRLALRYYQRALAFEEVSDNKEGVARMLGNIANVHISQGDYNQGLLYAQRSLKLREEVGDKLGLAMSLNNIGSAHEGLGDYEQAVSFYERSHALAKGVGSKEGMAITLLNIGLVFSAQDKYEAALDQFKKALALADATGNKRMAANALNHMALACIAAGDHTQALGHATRAGALAEKSNSLEALWLARTTEAKALRGLKHPARALQAAKEAVTAAEALRAYAAGGEREKQRIFESKVSPYHQIVALLAGVNETAEAFAYAERAKARTLVDVLQNGKLGAVKSLTGQEREREGALKGELVSLNAQLSREYERQEPDAARLAGLQSRLRSARLAYEDFQSGLYDSRPESQARQLRAQRGELRPLDSLQTAELLLDEKSALIEFVVADEEAFLFVLTRGGGQTPVIVRAYPLALKAKGLGIRVENFRKLLASREPFERFERDARQLYDLLLLPAAGQLKGKSNLIIVPDGPLWDLPFQVLQPAPGRFLLEDCAISYAPSLTALGEMRRAPKNRAPRSTAGGILAFGNPAASGPQAARVQTLLRNERLEPLADAEKEVAALAELYGRKQSRVFTGASASEERVKAEAGKYRVVQFATHGVLNDQSPMYSHLVMSRTGEEGAEDGLLEAWEMMNLDLNADMVVLSACETARGRIGTGEGMVGMTWALFIAGTPTTVASQWKVSSRSTASLMLEFHRNLRGDTSGEKAPVSKAEALRRAALKLMRRGGAYRHPFYWAAFVIVGDGG